jgi:hypothetical protein
MRRRLRRRQQLPRRLLAKLQTRPQELPGARRPPARCPQRLGPRGMWLQAAPPCQPNVPTGVFGNLGLSSFLYPFSPFSFQWGFILLIHFLPRSSPSDAATVMGTTASAVGTTAADATVGVTPGPAPDGQPQTPEGVLEDVVEDYEGEPEVVWKEAPVEGAMIVIRTTVAPPPSRGARAPLSSVPRRAAASGAATGEGMEVVLGHPTPYAPGNISVGEAVSTAHQALSQAQRILHREGEDLADKRRCLQLWASLFKWMTVSERAAKWARQHGFDLQVEAITPHDADSRRALVDAQELYASAEVHASAVTK